MNWFEQWNLLLHTSIRRFCSNKEDDIFEVILKEKM